MSFRRLLAAFEYDAFGQTQRATGPLARDFVFRFSTKWTDAETGELDYGRRRYSPSLGRFTSRDPIEEKGGMNLYAFVRNNPVSRWDYLGMHCWRQADGTMACERDNFSDYKPNEPRIELEKMVVRGSDSPEPEDIELAMKELFSPSFELNPDGDLDSLGMGPNSAGSIAPNNADKEWKPNKADCDALREKYPGAVVPSGKPTGLLSAFTSATIAAGAATSSGGMEYSSIIYRNSDGSFAYTAPIPVDGLPTRIGNQVFRSPLGGRLISDNPSGTTRVAATHGHNVGFSVYSDWINVRTGGTVVPTQSDYLHYGENFSRADVNAARTIGMMGVFTPSGSVLVYPFSKYGDLAAGAEMPSDHQVPGAPQGQDALRLQACINAKL